jgi:methionyl-tRNA formyltransferase
MKKTFLKNRIVFFGTPTFAAEILAYLLETAHAIVAVVTQPDRPQGRSSLLVSSPVKQVAPHLLCLQPEKASDPLFLAQLRELKADLYVVAAFGQILPQSLLDIPPLGVINVHTSLLPKYRGAAPIQRALMAGDPITGVTIMKIVRQLDAGDILAVAETPLPQEMTFGELEVELCALSKPLLASVLRAYEEGIPPSIPQDSTRVTFAPKINTDECKVDWSRSAQEIHNKIRALSPHPGAWCWVVYGNEKRRVKIFQSRVATNSNSNAPGALSFQKNSGLIVSCGIDAIELFSVQPEGKRPMNSAEWVRGYRDNFTQISFV